MKKISCVIPAFNEESRIGKVLDIIESQPNIYEIIVIDDGSSDKTKEIIIKHSKIRLISHKKNEGKSKSIYDGILNASGDYIFLLDADLVGLNKKNISDIIIPVIQNEADISISLRGNAPWIWRAINLDYISGERFFPKNILNKNMEHLLKLPRFGLEVFLNNLIIEKKYKIKIIDWSNVNSPYKYQKHGWYNGIKEDTFMILDILKTISPIKLLYQIVKMKQLSINKRYET